MRQKHSVRRRRSSRSGQSPQRTCIGCREVSDKRQLVRLVRTPEGRVDIDETAKRPGRGAYLCRRRACWETALQKRCLEHSLRLNNPLTKENLDTLRAFLETLPQEPD